MNKKRTLKNQHNTCVPITYLDWIHMWKIFRFLRLPSRQFWTIFSLCFSKLAAKQYCSCYLFWTVFLNTKGALDLKHLLICYPSLCHFLQPGKAAFAQSGLIDLSGLQPTQEMHFRKPKRKLENKLLQPRLKKNLIQSFWFKKEPRKSLKC